MKDKNMLQSPMDAYTSNTIAPSFVRALMKTCMDEESFSHPPLQGTPLFIGLSINLD